MKKLYSPSNSILVAMLIAFVCLFNTAQAQRCGLGQQDKEPGFKPILPQVPHNAPFGWRTNAGIAYVPLQFHIICSTGSNANWYLDTSLINQAVDTVNIAFKAADIQFCKNGVDIIYDDTYANLDHYSIYNHYKDIYTDTGVIHVYIPEGFGTQMIAGYAFQGGASSSGGLSGKYAYAGSGNAIALGGWILPYSPQDKWVLAHELGHYFGLGHTSNYTYNGQELCDGSNCDTTADYCCDTPPEYGDVYVDANCQLIPALNTTRDANGTLLQPDPRNIMSASTYSMPCRMYFTPDQIGRIRYFKSHYLNHLICNGTTAAYTVSRQSFAVNIYPNPATALQTISINTPAPGELSITIEDMTGKMLQKVYNGAIATGNTGLQLDLSSLTPGVYLVKLAYNNVVTYRKIIKE